MEVIKRATLPAICLCFYIGMISCDKKAELPAAAGVITGESQNSCPVAVVTLSITPVDKATSYQWYKNNAAITDATNSWFTVTESGAYTVAGVNENGTGAPSPAKAVNITHCPMMERMVGEWDVVEQIYQNTENGWQGPIPNIHVVSISQIDETTVKITGLYVSGEDDLVATVNLQTAGSETITIPTQEIFPSRYKGARTFVSPIVSETFWEGYGQNFHLPIKDVTGRLVIELRGGYTLGSNVYSYALGEVDDQGAYHGVAAYGVNTQWLKK